MANLLKKVLDDPEKAIRRVFTTGVMLSSFNIHGVNTEDVPYIDGIILLQTEKKGTIKIGKGCMFNSGRKCNPTGFENKMMLTTIGKGRITIGNNTGMSNTVIYSSDEVTIGDNVRIGNGTKIYDTDFHSLSLENRVNAEGDHDIKTAPVKIGDGVFIGAGVLILKGVTIGENAVVGACSVVTRSIPANETWAGNPAKKIK